MKESLFSKNWGTVVGALFQLMSAYSDEINKENYIEYNIAHYL